MAVVEGKVDGLSCMNLAGEGAGVVVHRLEVADVAVEASPYKITEKLTLIYIEIDVNSLILGMCIEIGKMLYTYTYICRYSSKSIIDGHLICNK